MPVRVQTADFDLSAEVAQLRLSNPRVGAVVSFVGTVRDLNDGAAVSEMELEHYPVMTERALEQIVEQAKARWPIFDALVIHRIGPMQPRKGTDARGRALGRCPRERRQRARQMETIRGHGPGR